MTPRTPTAAADAAWKAWEPALTNVPACWRGARAGRSRWCTSSTTRAPASPYDPSAECGAIADKVAPVAGEAVVAKHYPNSLSAPELDAHLKAAGVKNLVVVGFHDPHASTPPRAAPSTSATRSPCPPRPRPPAPRSAPDGSVLCGRRPVGRRAHRARGPVRGRSRRRGYPDRAPTRGTPETPIAIRERRASRSRRPQIRAAVRHRPITATPAAPTPAPSPGGNRAALL